MLLTHIKLCTMDWKERIQEIMKDQNISREELASRIGVSLSALGHWLTGRNDPSLLNIEKMSRELKVTPEFLLYGIEPPVIKSEFDEKRLKDCISAVYNDLLDSDDLISVDTLSEYVIELYKDPSDLDKPNKIKRFIEMFISKK